MKDLPTLQQLVDSVAEPLLGGTLGDHKIASVSGEAGGPMAVELTFPYPCARVRSDVERVVRGLVAPDGGGVEVRSGFRVERRTVQLGSEVIKGVKNVIAVSSAKGGVGKSTIAANMAVALAQEGAKVGLLDADIYGPSCPILMGLSGYPDMTDDNLLIPLKAHGLEVISIGFLVDVDTAIAWRGPLATRALSQLLHETLWEDVDYMVVDMPPGTGDLQLTLAQKVPVTGAVVVSTPQELALADARRGMQMFEKVTIDVLGVVENMGMHRCPKCGHESPIFGEDGAAEMCSMFRVPFLGSIPLHRSIRACSDRGVPVVVEEPDGEIAGIYREIAAQAAAKVALKSRDRSAAFPKIVVSDT